MSQFSELQQSLKEQGVRYAIGAYVDIHGVPKAKCVPINHLAHMMEGSELFTGFALEGLGQGPHDDEIAALPDPDSLLILPWKKEIAWFAAGNTFKGEPYPLSTRVALQKQIERAKSLGYTFNLGIEAEIYVLKQDENGQLHVPNADDNQPKACYDVKRMLDGFEFLDTMVTYMDELGWDVYSFDHEDGHGQYEFDFAYSDALTMSDRYIFFRLMAKHVAAQEGLLATFMAKPFADKAGTGAHFNMSLADSETGENLFKSSNDPRGVGLSEIGYQFIGGMKAHGRGLMAVAAPTINSYKRLVRKGQMGYYSWAPVFNALGHNNRAFNYRVPMGGGRVEFRGADSSCNPYLAAALMLAAGLDGIERKLDAGVAHHENVYEHSRAELLEIGIEELPKTLDEAIDAFESDEWFKEVLGEELCAEFVGIKRGECEDYHNTISDWEVQRYARFY